MAGQADTDALAVDQFLQEAVMNDSAHSPQKPAASASHGPGHHTDNLNSNAKADGLGDPEHETRHTDLKEDLLEAIDGISSVGSFAASGGPKGIRVPDPGIFVRGVGPIDLPFDRVQAQKLKQRAHLAHLGNGNETVVDAGAGNSCELQPHHFEIRNPHWAKLVEKATIWAAQQLGLKPGVSSRLHKMLLCEKSATLKSHAEYVNLTASPLIGTRSMPLTLLAALSNHPTHAGHCSFACPRCMKGVMSSSNMNPARKLSNPQRIWHPSLAGILM